MRNVITMYRREVSSYFSSPIVYIFLILFLLAVSAIFFGYFGFFSQASPDVRMYFELFPLLLAFVCAAISMRLWAEEFRNGTVELLLTWPLRSWELVIAKYLAGLTIVVLTLVLTIVGPLTVSTVTEIDWGVILSSYLGAFVVSSVYVALGAWISTFTRNQVVALLVAAGASSAIWVVGRREFIKWLNDLVSLRFGNFLGWFSPEYHFQEFAKGLINPVGIIYGLGMTAVFLVLNNLFVEGRKY